MCPGTNALLTKFSALRRLAIFLFSLGVSTLNAATLFVSLKSTNPVPPYLTWDTAAANIQDAIGAAQPGDSVLASNGVYVTGSVTLGGTASRVALTNGINLLSLNGAQSTFIDASRAMRCIYVGSNCVLNGFTLINGHLASGSGGGAWCEQGALLANCNVISNYSYNGAGGIYGGILTNCLLTLNSNSAGWGAGVAFSTVYSSTLLNNASGGKGGGAASSSLYNCTLQGNDAGDAGGAVASTLYNCKVIGNQTLLSSSDAFYFTGGGTDSCTNYNCLIAFNSASDGGGTSMGVCYNCLILSNSAAKGAYGGGTYGTTLYNCTVCGNTSTSYSGAVLGTAYNSIVYFNSPSNWTGGTFDHCCTLPLPPGPGNITNDPAFVDPSGGVFRLKCGSACIDAGTNYSFLPTNDFRGVFRPLDGDGDGIAQYDIGAFEYDPVNDVAPVIGIHLGRTNFFTMLQIPFYAQVGGCDSMFWWDFGDGNPLTNQLLVNYTWTNTGDYQVALNAYYPALNQTLSATQQIQIVTRPVYYVNASNTTPAFPYTNWTTAATHLQDAVSASSYAGRIVLVTDGIYSPPPPVYPSNVVTLSDDVILQSVNGPAQTIIQGPISRCAYVGNNAFLSGFTLRLGNPNIALGGGVYCAAGGTLSNCIVTGNGAASSGGGVYGGELYSCTLSNNYAQYGGGAYACDLFNCTLITNTARSSSPDAGGGARSSTLHNCQVVGNSANGGGSGGGGTAYSSLYNCVVASNHALFGAGVSFSSLFNCLVSSNYGISGGGGAAYYSTLFNCLVVSNWGGGVYSSTNYNCTIAFNSANGGINGNCGSLNCVIYSNLPVNWSLGSAPSFPFFSYCCTTPLPPYPNNFTNNPMFVNPGAGDFSLRFGSPCIDAGTNLSSLITNDLIGTARPLDGDGNGVAAFDIGAYEFNLLALVGTNWLVNHGLDPNDPLVFASDPDHDGLTTLQEWVAGTDPTNASSFFNILAVSNEPPLTVFFNTTNQRAYSLYSSSNLTSQWMPVPGQVALPGNNSIMTLQDTNSASAQFYRVGVGLP